MTQNKTGVSTLLLRYQVAGQDQLLKANTAAALSFKEAEKAAAKLGISIERLQELGGARIDAINLSDKPVAAAKELEKAQKATVDAVDNRLKTEEKVSAELKAQAAIVEKQSKGIRDIGMQRIPEPSLGDFGVRDTRSVRGTLTGVREGLIALPNVGYQNPAVVALRGLIPLVDKTGASFTQLGLSLGLAGAAAIGVAIFVDRLNRVLEDGKRILNGALSAQENYYQALGDLTSNQAATQAAELQRLRPILEQQVAELRNALESAFQLASHSPLGDVGARALFNQLPTGALKEQLDKVEAALQENIQTEARLTQGREAGVFAANDAIEAERKLAEERIKQFQDALQGQESQALQDLDILKELTRGTSEGIKQRIEDAFQEAQAYELLKAGSAGTVAALESQIAALKALPATYGDQSQAIADLESSLKDAEATLDRQTKRYNTLTSLYQGLLRILDLVTDREQKAAEAALALSDALSGIAYTKELAAQLRTATVEQVADRLNAIEEERRALATYLPELIRLAPTSQEAANALKEAQDSLTSLSLEYNDQISRVLPAALSRARAELSADLAKLESDRNAKFTDIEATRLEKEAEAADKRGEAYTAAEEKRGDALNDLAEKQAEQRQRIEKKSNAEIANAIFARDALAAYLAMQQKQEQLDDLKADGEKRQREIDKQYEKERQQANRNYEKSLQQAQQAADKARNAARRQYDVEYNERVSAYNQQLALLRNFVSQANAELSNLTVPSLSSGLVNGTSGGTSNPPALPNSPYGVPPVNPQIGDTWTDAFGQLRVWNGHGWQAASAVRGYATGGVAQGLARINDGGGVESGMYNSNQLALFTKPTRIFSAQQTQRLFGRGGGGGLNIHIPIQGSKLSKDDIKDIVDETLDETLPAEWDEAW